MRKLIFNILAYSIFTSAFAQENAIKNPYTKRPALGFSLTFHDFQTAEDLKNSSVSDVLDENQWSKTGRMTPGLAVSYFHGLTNHLDFMARVGGTFVSYPVPDKPVSSTQKMLLEMDANVNAKMLSDKYWVTPYLTAGVGASQWKGYWGAYVPLGWGLQVNLFDKAYINLNVQYRVAVTTSTTANHLFYSFGFAGSLFDKKEPAVIPPPPPSDTDEDSIVDSLDACPTVFGLPQFNGCPDGDGDGIPDKDDKCPDLTGLAKYGGCPIPDTDGDGINDEEDQCPNEKGLVKYSGCPAPDTDGDGVNDEEDKCPNVAGPGDNFGCPVLGIKSYEIVFKTGRATLLPRGRSILDTAATYLHNHPAVNVVIEGHTDNTGTDKINDLLSKKRADAAKAYLVSKGIAEDRMTTKGYGSTNPIADNKTSEGRAINRRIEIRIQ